MRIENWFVTDDADPYTPPECRRVSICGNVYGNPRFPEGHHIRTSDVVGVNGNDITTRSGSVYTLGEPSADYTEWCRKNNLPDPIKILKI